MTTPRLLAAPLLLVTCMAQPGEPNTNAPPTGTLPDGPLTACDIAGVVLVPRCAGCHRPAGQKPDLSSIDAVKALVGASITSGNKDASLLYRKLAGVQAPSEGARMPVGAPLDEALIAATGRWIDEGADTECTLDGPLPTPDTHHPAGWALPENHGRELEMLSYEEPCTTCHGATLEGDVGPSCDSCHVDTGWRSNCTFCHGGKDDDSGAPPRDLGGELTALSFLAHTPHRAATVHPSFTCDRCHLVPTDVLSLGHVFDDTRGQAEVVLTSPHQPNAEYLGQGRCANLYCHGNGQSANGSADHHTPPVCGSCHAGPANPTEWRTMSGAHEKHLDERFTCRDCHADTVDAGGRIIGPLQHVDGMPDVVIAPVNPVTKTGVGCTGTCHEEAHVDRDWREDDP